ncbi:unnamed protein product [Effrenium voratum]|nr:unnamed protein product [Effrenium voratum]CAJ1446032.1 unnamed protein product [Effrenium voratum]
MRRMFAAKASGKRDVPDELLQQWEDVDKGREQLIKIFLETGLDKEEFLKRSTRRIRQKIQEKDMYTDGEFVSEEDMKNHLLLKERIRAIKAECAKRKGWIRRDKYEKHVKLFWVEIKTGGRMLPRGANKACN